MSRLFSKWEEEAEERVWSLLLACYIRLVGIHLFFGAFSIYTLKNNLVLECWKNWCFSKNKMRQNAREADLVNKSDILYMNHVT